MVGACLEKESENMLTFIVTRKRGCEPEIVIGEGSWDEALVIIGTDLRSHVEEREGQDCPAFTYRTAVVMAIGTAKATPDGKRNVTSRLVSAWTCLERR
jgi:hypothetical protein